MPGPPKVWHLGVSETPGPHQHQPGRHLYGQDRSVVSIGGPYPRLLGTLKQSATIITMGPVVRGQGTGRMNGGPY